MKKFEFEKLDLTLYQEKLSNDLEVFVIPQNSVNNIYATFTTKFGSNQIDFTTKDSKEMTSVPPGIAHFLEHKMFEQEDGIEPFNFFCKNGSHANAYTDQTKTTYLFSGPSHIKENLNYLLDYVQSPYLTDENVEKEKGIITQELKMYQDEPDFTLYEELLANTFENHPMKESIGGTIKSVNSITKEQLYACYNTFYHPSNMFVIITGNVNPEEIIELVKLNQSKKDFKEKNKITLKTYNEPDEVAKKHGEKELNVAIKKCGITFKIKRNINYSPYDNFAYLMLLFEIKFSNTSLFSKSLLDDKITNEDLVYSTEKIEDYILVSIFGVSDEASILLEKIKEEMQNLEVNEKEFNRKKKTILSSFIYMSDDIFNTNQFFIDSIINYNMIDQNFYEKIKDLNFEEFNKIIKTTNFNNYTTYIINKKK